MGVSSIHVNQLYQEYIIGVEYMKYNAFPNVYCQKSARIL